MCVLVAPAAFLCSLESLRGACYCSFILSSVSFTRAHSALTRCFRYLGAGPHVVFPSPHHCELLLQRGICLLHWSNCRSRQPVSLLTRTPGWSLDAFCSLVSRPRGTYQYSGSLLDLLRGRQSAHGHAFPPEADSTVAVVVHLGFPVPESRCWPTLGKSLPPFQEPTAFLGSDCLLLPVAIWLRWARMIETCARKGRSLSSWNPRVLDIF